MSAAMLRAEGAGVTLEPSRGEHGTLFVTGRDGGDDAVPGVVLTGEHYNLIARLVEQGVPVELAVNVQGTFHEEDAKDESVCLGGVSARTQPSPRWLIRPGAVVCRHQKLDPCSVFS